MVLPGMYRRKIPPEWYRRNSTAEMVLLNLNAQGQLVPVGDMDLLPMLLLSG
jgi:hypothetical protein